MKRGTWADDLAGIRAASNEMTITTAELRAFGLSSAAIVERCLTEGPWQRLLPGIILLHNGLPSDRQRIVGALRYAGPGAMLTGLTGVGLHGLNANSSVVTVLISHESVANQ